MADLHVTPEVLESVSSEFSTVADQLRTGLDGVDGEVASLLGAGWKGGAASAFGQVWQQWHEGAGKVHEGLTAMSTLLGAAAQRYRQTDVSGTATVEGSGL